MPRRRQSKTAYAQEIVPSSTKLDAINSWLAKMLDRFPQKGTITESEVVDWHHDLTPFSLEAIEYAFDAHRRNAIFFPMNAQILDLCISYDPPGTKVVSTARCDIVCKSRHGKGYGEEDMKRLWGYVERELAKGDTLDMDALLNELDSKRPGGAPEFRR